MKRVATMLFALGVLSSVCFGQSINAKSQKESPPPPLVKKAVLPSEIKGIIEAIDLPEPAKGIRPKISLLVEEGKQFVFMVRSTTTVYGSDWKAIALDKLEQGREVRVQYITNKEGFLEALSIKPANTP
ncbi:MAG: hypothetical protein ABFD81_02465 [Syntrophaceae bacterium]|jgi:hypothetical protein